MITRWKDNPKYVIHHTGQVYDEETNTRVDERTNAYGLQYVVLKTALGKRRTMLIKNLVYSSFVEPVLPGKTVKSKDGTNNLDSLYLDDMNPNSNKIKKAHKTPTFDETFAFA